MHLLSATDLTAVRDGRTLFADLTLGLTTADRVGVIGPNGCGKSTLLDILAGVVPPDGGEVVVGNDVRIGYLPQRPDTDPGARTRDVVRGGRDRSVREHEALAMLDRLDVPADARVGELSEGQTRRVALARALLLPADLLLLDEPTNHLDVDTIDWLEQRLDHHAGGLLVVTHDRYFLERLTTRMLEIERLPGREPESRLYWHEGSYSDVLAAREQRRERRREEAQRRKNLLRKEIAWLQRDPKARTSKPKFRREQAEQLMAAPLDEEPVQLDLGTGRRRLGTHVLDVEDVHVAYGDEQILRGVDWSVGPGERVGLVGPNGSGKTTLLEVVASEAGAPGLAGRRVPDRGEVHLGSTVELAMYEQEQSAAPAGTTVLESVTAIAPRIPLASGETLPAERLCERFGFDSRMQRQPVNRLSGGERRRLALLHTLVRAPNVLILDEPTNDLDLDTLTVLEDHLDGFAGTLIVCSHDRFVLDRLTDRVHGLIDGRLEQFLDWAQYRERREQRRRREQPGTQRRSSSAAANRRRQELVREQRSVEQRLGKLADARAALHEEIAAAGADYQRAADLDRTLTEVEREEQRLEERWLDLADLLA